MYNISFTSIPILVFGLFDQDFSSEQLTQHLQLYQEVAGNSLMSRTSFCKWNLLGIIYILYV